MHVRYVAEKTSLRQAEVCNYKRVLALYLCDRLRLSSTIAVSEVKRLSVMSCLCAAPYVPVQVSESNYRRDPVSKVSLLTLDMEKSIDFYQDVSVDH